jgi:hypothetical protein
MQDRRIQERRNPDSRMPVFRYSGQGNVVLLDRRRIPDRRLNNIHIEFIPLYEFYK